MYYYTYVLCLLQLASQHGIKLYETSAWKDVNVTDAFTSLTELVLNEVTITYSTLQLNHSNYNDIQNKLIICSPLITRYLAIGSKKKFGI